MSHIHMSGIKRKKKKKKNERKPLATIGDRVEIKKMKKEHSHKKPGARNF